MKSKTIFKISIILSIIALFTGAYIFGFYQGHSSGFKDGSIWERHNTEIIKGLRTVALLQVLKTGNVTRVEEALNHDLNYAIFSLVGTDKEMHRVKIPSEIKKQIEVTASAFNQHVGDDKKVGYRSIAKFRSENPSQLVESDIRKTVSEFSTKYK